MNNISIPIIYPYLYYGLVNIAIFHVSHEKHLYRIPVY
jgi:hypothetical protein